MSLRTITLSGLPNTKKPRVAVWVKTKTDAYHAITSHDTISSADDYGAINIWKDDDGKWRCEFYLWLAPQNSSSFQLKKDVRSWILEWWPKMKRKPSQHTERSPPAT